MNTPNGRRHVDGDVVYPLNTGPAIMIVEQLYSSELASADKLEAIYETVYAPLILVGSLLPPN